MGMAGGGKPLSDFARKPINLECSIECENMRMINTKHEQKTRKKETILIFSLRWMVMAIYTIEADDSQGYQKLYSSIVFYVSGQTGPPFSVVCHQTSQDDTPGWPCNRCYPKGPRSYFFRVESNKGWTKPSSPHAVLFCRYERHETSFIFYRGGLRLKGKGKKDRIAAEF